MKITQIFTAPISIYTTPTNPTNPPRFHVATISNNFLNSTWGHDGQGSTSGHGGQSSTSTAGQNNPLTQVYDFVGLNDDEHEQLYGQGHRQRSSSKFWRWRT
jgi:hypothetical protein